MCMHVPNVYERYCVVFIFAFKLVFHQWHPQVKIDTFFFSLFLVTPKYFIKDLIAAISFLSFCIDFHHLISAVKFLLK